MMNPTMTTLDIALMLSDIDFLRWYDHTVGFGAEEERWRKELAFYDFTLSDEAYAAHYALHEGRFYDSSVLASFLSPETDKMPRISKIVDLLGQVMSNQNGCADNAYSVLDFGCSAGHVTRAMARRFPNALFMGTDVVERAVKLTHAMGPDNVEARMLDDVPRGGFDVVIATEVLEHVRDPYAVIDGFFAEILRPGGTLIATLPWGPWESQGWTEEDPSAREHLRHWGCAELLEVFGPSARLAYDVSQMTRLGVPVGNSYVVATRRVGRVNMKRKLEQYCELAEAERWRVDAWRSGLVEYQPPQSDQVYPWGRTLRAVNDGGYNAQAR